MLGLVALEHIEHPNTSLDKLIFLIKHIPQANLTTTSISIGAFVVLVLCRQIKVRCKKYWFIYRIPEVLVVVLVSTCVSHTSNFTVKLMTDDHMAIVLCKTFRWDLDGVHVLGLVEISTGDGSFFQFPARASNLKFFKRTTSTAMYVPPMLSFPLTSFNSLL